MMKNIAYLMVGLILFILAVIYPLPTIFAVSGIVWRILIGLLGCFSFTWGIYKTVRKNNE